MPESPSGPGAAGDARASDRLAADATHVRDSSPTGPGTCDSCGRPVEAGDEPLVAVHRVYVTPESWDTPGRVDMVDEVERWCFVCRTHYPHEEVT